MSSNEPTIDLSSCEREPIHIPGSIQPHGFLVGFSQSGVVNRISRNLPPAFNLAVDAILNVAVEDTPVAIRPLLRDCFTLKNRDDTRNVVLNNTSMLARQVSCDQSLVVDIEHNPSDKIATEQDILEAFSTLSKLEDIPAIADHVAMAIRQMLYFDRVMVYRFDFERSGTVISEAKSPELRPYLGLHFPASDIPPQAHELYKRNLSRMVCDVDYEPVPIVSTPNTDSLDLSNSNLRSVSPVHIQYLKNMGVRASQSFSLLVNGQLWGLVACHQCSGLKYVHPSDRARAEAFVAMSARLITSKEEIEYLNVEIKNRENIATFFAVLRTGESLNEVATLFERRVCAITNSTGFALVFGETIHCWGRAPDVSFVRELARWLDSTMGSKDHFQTRTLSSDLHSTMTAKDSASGILAVRLPRGVESPQRDGFMIWFRPEVISTVNWAGKPEHVEKFGPSGKVIGPRESFEIWQQRVELSSLPWTKVDVSAAQQFKSQFEQYSVDDAENSILRAALQRAEKLSALGHAISEVAHDLRSPLGQIESAVDFLRQDLTIPPDSQEIFDLIPLSLKAAQHYMDDILNFSKDIKLEKAECNVTTFLTEFCSLLRVTSMHKNVAVNLIQRDEFTGCFDAVRIGRALMNISNNAVDALYQSRANSPLISIGAHATDQQITFVVSDNGPGIPEEVLSRLFQPFATSGKSEGTGLGLSIARKMVVAHDGIISVESSPAGTEFSIRIPR